MYQITKQFSFEASHQLDGMPEGHQCGRLHGHSYRVEIVIESVSLDANGFVIDYGDLKPFEARIKAEFDHRHLNDVLNGCNPTAENLAIFLYYLAVSVLKLDGRRNKPRLIACRVSETGKTWAEYR